MAVRLSALRTGHALHLRNIIYLLVRLEGLVKLKHFNDLKGNRTRDLPDCDLSVSFRIPPFRHICITYERIYRVIKREFYKFESLHKFIQRACTMF
jgi:hypothetical protein